MRSVAFRFLSRPDAMDDDDVEVIIVLGLFLAFLLAQKAKNKRFRSMRVHPYLMDRNSKGRYQTDVS